MKNKEDFNLEKALQGHPLITRDGKTDIELHFFKNVKSSFCLAAIVDKGFINTYNTVGDQFKTAKSKSDLFLDTSKPWSPEPKMGDIVEVATHKNNLWYRRVFLFKRQNKFFCIEEEKTDFNNNDSFLCESWECMKPLPTVKITIDIGGKETILNELPTQLVDYLKNYKL